jgi:hypothetical protein
LAKTENEGIRTSYNDPKLAELTSENHQKLQNIYQRYNQAKIDVYPHGIGFVNVPDNLGKKHYYLLVDVRPRNIKFGMGQTTPKERLNEVIQRHFEKNLRLVGEEDIGMNGVEGLAFAVHWPVRDLSQCDSHGGYLEYAMIYFPKSRFVSLKQGKKKFSDVLRETDVITSLGMKDAAVVRVGEE